MSILKLRNRDGTWSIIRTIRGEPGPMPTEYVADASVSSSKLTLTKADGSKVEFAGGGGGGGSSDWNDITNKPEEFPPSAHNHAISDVNGLENALKGKADANAIPTKTSDLTNDSNYVSDSKYTHTDNNYTDAEKTKLGGLTNYNDTEVRQAIRSLEDGKIDKNQGADNKDKVLGVNAEGDVTNLPVSYGLRIQSVGLTTDAATNAKINSRSNYFPITPAQLVYAWNSVACSTNENEQLTDEQKTNAQIRLGILSSEGVTF